MIKKYSLVFIAFLCFVMSGYGQITIATQDFEITPATPTMTFTGGSIATGNGLFPNAPKYVSGLRGRQVNDATQTIIFSTVDASAYTNIFFTCRLASFAGTSGNGNDGDDEVYVDISTDGGTTWSRELEIEGENNAKWSFTSGTATASTNYDGDDSAIVFAPSGGGNRTFDGYSTIRVNNLPNSVNLRVRLVINNNSNNEYWVFDDAEIQGTIAVTPNVVLDSANPSIAASNIIQGTDNTPIHAFDLSATLSNATLTDLDFITTGTYAASNITNFKLWYSSDATFDSSSDTFLDNITTNLGIGSHTFTGFSQTINNTTTGYFFITTDLPCDATATNTIGVSATTTSDITFSPVANKSGTASASGIHTIQTVAPQNATGFNTQNCENESTTVNWTDPAGCFDNVLVFATNTSFTATTPTGTGVLYTAATSFGGGTAFDGGFCVYKGTGTTEDITNLTNGTNYTFKIFTRKDTDWSNGVTVNCSPTVSYCNAGPTNSNDSEIENVSLIGENNSINNNTTDICTNGINNFTSQNADLEIGGNYSLDVEFGDCDNGTQFDGSGGVWIDWNNDGDFDDTNETVGVINISMTASDTNVIETFTINVPALQPIGFYRMRIVQEEGATATATPCGTFTWGSVEDYTIEVINSCTPVHTISSIAPTSGPIGTEITVTGTGFTNSTSANFAGINALVTFISNTEILIEVPSNASTGTISVFESSCAISTPLFTVLEPLGDCSSSSFTDLFISEIYDASSGNSFYLELYNPTDTDINMEASGSDYEIERYTDFGNATPSETYDLEGIVLANSTYVIRFTNTNPCNTIASSTYDNSGGLGNGINENDRVTLTKNNSDHDTFICPNETGFSYSRDNDATAPSTTYIPTDWDEDLTESCSDLNMFNPSDDPPIVTGPDDVSGCDLTEVVFTVSATPGNSGSLTYQWYFNDGFSSSWLELNSTNFTNAAFSGEDSNQLIISDGYYNYVGYQFYCLVSEDASCEVASNAAQLKIPLTVWNSANWSNGIPNTSTIAIIDDNYTTGQTNQPSFEACTLIINAGNELDVRNGDYVLVQNNVIVNGITTDVNVFELTVQTQGSFVQVADNGTFTSNPGATTRVLKNTSLLNNWYDYTYWSSPVQGETVQDAFPETPADRRYWFDSSNYNDAFYESNNDGAMTAGAGVDDIDDEGDDWTEASGAFSTMIEGVGYAATYNPNPPPPATYPLIGTATFTGPFNTGNITPEIVINSVTGDNDWNLIGNPYPGAIDFIAFHGYSDSTYNNANLIDGCAYLWSHSTPPDADTNGNENLNFSQNDYAIITTGSGCLAGGSGVIPDTFIPSGQSFFVKGLNNGDLIFKNAFRDTGNNTQFFEPNNSTPLEVNNTDEANKIWLNLTSDNGIFNQILVAYVDGATNEFDGFAFDATRNISTGVEAIIYTEIENVELKKFAIQGKAIISLSNDEVIPVGFKTNIEAATIYTFSIAQLEGAFLNENVIYLRDNLLDTYHNLKESDYNFTSDVGEFNDRFEIVFNQEALSLGESELNTNSLTIIEHNSGKVEFKVSNNLQIKSIEIIDITGKSIYNFKVQEGGSTIYNLSALSQAAYIAKVELTDGRIITRKAIKQK